MATVGLDAASLLGLTSADWINLGISLAIVVLGYVTGTWLDRRLFRWVTRRTSEVVGVAFLDAIGSDLRWLVVLLATHFATIRLTFISADLKRTLGDIYFVVGLTLVLRIVWSLIDLASKLAREMSTQQDRVEELAPVITLFVRTGRTLVVMIAGIILLSHFGVDAIALAAALGIGGLAFSLAARDTIADAIAGFIILVDRPFRIGDRIEIRGIDTWGDVVNVGLRSTRIRTRDNRMVIVPNSIIGKNEVINYSYPDPSFRIQTHVSIAYGTHIQTARHIILETVRQEEGVMPDKPVDALYIEMGASAMVFRVRWWIDSYADTRRATDQVHTALQDALDGAGIEMPFTTYDLNLRLGAQEIDRISNAVET